MSASSKPTLAPRRLSATARLLATVLLPTPPLPLITSTTLFTSGTGSSAATSRAGRSSDTGPSSRLRGAVCQTGVQNATGAPREERAGMRCLFSGFLAQLKPPVKAPTNFTCAARLAVDLVVTLTSVLAAASKPGITQGRRPGGVSARPSTPALITPSSEVLI